MLLVDNADIIIGIKSTREEKCNSLPCYRPLSSILTAMWLRCFPMDVSVVAKNYMAKDKRIVLKYMNEIDGGWSVVWRWGLIKLPLLLSKQLKHHAFLLFYATDFFGNDASPNGLTAIKIPCESRRSLFTARCSACDFWAYRKNTGPDSKSIREGLEQPVLLLGTRKGPLGNNLGCFWSIFLRLKYPINSTLKRRTRWQSNTITFFLNYWLAKMIQSITKITYRKSWSAL